MEIKSSGIVNRYIATQGPLPNTAVDFWYMVWEQNSTTIAMLTTLKENDRVKCHQYWPNVGQTTEYGSLQITNVFEREDEKTLFQYRELSIRHKIVSGICKNLCLKMWNICLEELTEHCILSGFI